MKTHIRILVLALMTFGLTVAKPALTLAHGADINVGVDTKKTPVKLTAAQEQAIGLKTAAAGPHPMATILNLNGEIQLPPDKQADVSSILSGAVGELDASLGDKVKAGQQLALIKNRTPVSQDIIIKAPMDGTVDARDVVLGQPIEPTTTLFHISDRSKMIAVGKVYEEDLSKVKVGQEAHVRLLGYPGDVFTGKVTLVEPNLDAASRIVRAWVQLDNPQDVLKPNLFAKITVILKQDNAALVVPNGAIIEANGEKVVFVKNGDAFSRVEVTVGASDDEFTEIKDGLVPGDEVATQGSREIYTMWLTGGKMEAEE
jgi:multidrug efflux pump subunit AcrA (membrane-fusion protein)